MKTIALILAGLFLLPLASLRAATNEDASTSAKANQLLHELQADLSTVKSRSLIDLADFKEQSITGDSRDGWNTYYRYGDVRFRDRNGGYDITPQSDSIAVLQDDSLYLGLTIASSKDIVAVTRSFDLGSYLPGCRLYVYYRENLFGQSYLTNIQPTPTERQIYKKISGRLAALGVTEAANQR